MAETGLVASLAAPSVYSIDGRSPDVRDALAIGTAACGSYSPRKGLLRSQLLDTLAASTR